MFIRTLTLAACIVAGPALSAPITLAPADPQPDEADLSAGLAVSYAYPSKVKTLEAATKALQEEAEAGEPLIGLSYLDGDEGDLVMTAKKHKKVAAAISGYIKFDEAGTFEVDFFSNDGIAVSIGGQPVALYDEVHACEPAGVQEIEVPEAGWYELEATYFQSKGTACLMMDWNLGDGMEPVPDTAFAFKN